MIVDTSARLSLPYRPLVVATGGRLTDVADAYLIDPTVTERVVVVSSLGTTTASGAAMAAPNGEMDPWADAIVTAHFRFVQVSAFYDQLTDVPAVASVGAARERVRRLDRREATEHLEPARGGRSGRRRGGRRSELRDRRSKRVSATALIGAGATAGPDLVADPDGAAWLVTQNASAEATGRFWNGAARSGHVRPLNQRPYPAATMLACTALSIASEEAPDVMTPSKKLPCAALAVVAADSQDDGALLLHGVVAARGSPAVVHGRAGSRTARCRP